MGLARHAAATVLAGALLIAGSALAYPGDWGGMRGWDSARSGADPREGRVSAERFVADGAAAVLGHGPVSVSTQPGGTGDARETATFEAAVVDQLAKAGYETARPDATGGQVAEVHVVRDMLVPPEEKHSPVSGGMTVGASNRGSMFGLALSYDATKPRTALIETRMEARIRERATGRLLWEGRAAIATREGDRRWNDNAVAARLAGALFDRFPAGGSLAGN